MKIEFLGTPQGKPGVCIASLQSSPASIRDVPIRDGSESTRGTGVFLGGRYSKQKVIDYGGIPEATVLGVRTSERIKAQPNADATQLERAQQNAQAREDILYSGSPYGYSLDPYVVLSPVRGAAGCHGVWVQPTGDGSTGFLQPVWVAA